MSSNGDLMDLQPRGSFWEPGNYKRTVKRVDDGHKLCSELAGCFQERAKIEKSYSLQLADWARRWRGIVEKVCMGVCVYVSVCLRVCICFAGAQYGTLEKAWQSFMNAADRLSEVHMQMREQLAVEESQRILHWQKEAFHKQIMGGFRETKQAEEGFHKAQKHWAKKLKDVESSRTRYHQARKAEQAAVDRETIAKADTTKSQDEVRKLQVRVEKCNIEAEKAKARYEKALEELNRCNPRYMEDMEQVFEITQDAEKKRLCFFKEVLQDIHKHMDLSSNDSVTSIFRELSQAIAAASDVEDLRWWRNTHGPGMHMNWPQFEAWSPEDTCSISPKETDSQVEDVSFSAGDEAPEMPPESPRDGKDNASDWSDESGKNYITANGIEEDEKITGVPVKALYDYEGEEEDELSFKAGDLLMKLGEEDEQGWCKGQLDDGQIGLYPANYVEVVGS
ncbi:protein kinase C and casein kinase II substrate protein 3-like isoform X1 [Anguilla anguilla]|uniref:protein kinase C and casein kinase II substrate protein 3-like isoform X1 n=1 Tax=Anguilla anguilla TaxID=7936 RepID=UPI0015AA26BE|nr:protein kinase C and casein kinase II substrate protein 3-like isoform X1 [Anguilla anguilla]XP_035251297.1 protein kinase C and casein kinase II substrate protein 3-like isoform X1 [Anguilla anguilla]XP_035251298.1 protein kinase C and casein kinase II substrate protein 3-like isoform X1 [Anguilla anguilla]XP_035251299.1 protein kinase C and casein kinase II substrate protein 3-like isoform X1 [Anguilla anguilla]